MRCDCHMHMILDGAFWRAAIRRHDPVPDDAFIHSILKTYQQQGFTMIPAREILLEGETTIDVQGKQHPVASAE